MCVHIHLSNCLYKSSGRFCCVGEHIVSCQKPCSVPSTCQNQHCQYYWSSIFCGLLILGCMAQKAVCIPFSSVCAANTEFLAEANSIAPADSVHKSNTLPSMNAGTGAQRKQRGQYYRFVLLIERERLQSTARLTQSQQRWTLNEQRR